MNSDSRIQPRKPWVNAGSLPKWFLTCVILTIFSSASAQSQQNPNIVHTRPVATNLFAAPPQSDEAFTCPKNIVDETLAVPKLGPITEDTTTVTATLPVGTRGHVGICVNGKPAGIAFRPDLSGAFSVPLDTKLKAGETVEAQLFLRSVDEDGKEVVRFGPPSQKVTVTQGSCKKAGSLSLAEPPTLVVKTNSDDTLATYSGTINSNKSTSASIRICVNDIPATNPISIQDGKFDGGTASISVKRGDKITAQVVSSDNPPGYSPVSTAFKVGTVTAAKSPSAIIVMIAGYEQAGYSAMGLSGNAFVQMFYGGPSTHNWSGWGKVRLLGAPQAATEGVVGSFTNPQGQITTQSYSTVGQALDFTVGPRLQLSQNWGIIADVGATTPLSSQSTPLTFVVPAAGTVECSTLISRFSPQNGYNPGLAASTTPGTCLQGGYTDIAFANQDRSNFLLKYAAGFRTTFPRACQGGTAGHPCSNAYSVLDVTLGQDESISGGRLHGPVFKLDGELPVPISGSSWLYLFGSAYIRLQGNVNLSPLILQVPTTPVTVPSPSVFVLPLRQPNRDYFRIGIGLNLDQVLCKMSASGCPNPNSGSTSPLSSGSS